VRTYRRPPISDESLDRLMAIEAKIQDHIAQSHRLRAQQRRQFDPGYLYVVEFDSGVVKVGKTVNAESRLAAHARAGLVRSSWASLHHLECSKTERQLVAFCTEHGTVHSGREYFRDLDFGLACACAERIVRDHLAAEKVPA
jgi:hypothetical protein